MECKVGCSCGSLPLLSIRRLVRRITETNGKTVCAAHFCFAVSPSTECQAKIDRAVDVTHSFVHTQTHACAGPRHRIEINLSGASIVRGRDCNCHSLHCLAGLCSSLCLMLGPPLKKHATVVCARAHSQRALRSGPRDAAEHAIRSLRNVIL